MKVDEYPISDCLMTTINKLYNTQHKTSRYIIGIDFATDNGDKSAISGMCAKCENFIFLNTANAPEEIGIPVVRKCPKCGIKFSGFVGAME
jgi:hypothetical protein